MAEKSGKGEKVIENTLPTVEQLEQRSIPVEEAKDRVFAYLRKKGEGGIQSFSPDLLFRGFLGSALASVMAKVKVRRDLEEKAIAVSKKAGGLYQQKLPADYIQAEHQFVAYIARLRQAFDGALKIVWEKLKDEPPNKRQSPEWRNKVFG